MAALHRIRILGSNRLIDAPAGDSVLQCGLRAGLNLPYNCEQGRCGECRARRVSGRLAPLFHTDFTFSHAEQAQGWFLACAHGAASDLELELSGLGSLDDLPLQTVAARVRAVERPDPECLLLRLRSPRSAVLRFVAGQQVEILHPGLPPGRRFLANCPCDAARPELHLGLKADADTPIASGDLLRLRGPYGRFVLPVEPLGPLVFACWETGFAAVQSLLEQALALGPGGPVHLWWCGRRRALRYRDNYCRALADSDEAIAYRGVELPRPEAMADWVGSQVLPIAPAADVFVVAPDRALAGLRAAFIRLGAAPQRLRLARLD